jgi:CRISPR type I-E-associated protein CasB/Cse2
MTRDPRFRNHDAPEAAILRSWHRGLLTQPRRGDRAQLKRAGTIEEAATAPAFHDLLRRLGVAPAADLRTDPRSLTALAALAALAAGVKDSDAAVPSARLGSTLAQGRKGSAAPRVSAARFRRLLESEEIDERFAVLRRLLPLVERQVDLVELAAAICDWSPRRRRQLAYDYYANAPLTSEETPS